MKGWIAATAATAGLLVLLTACESETEYAAASGAGGPPAQASTDMPRLLETKQYRAAPAPGSMAVDGAQPPAGDRFPEADPNKWQAAVEHPVSTFSIDVDTASYAFVRRMLREGRLPPRDAVRIEEMVNYFPYAYPGPDSAAEPFRASVTVLPSPWNEGAKLLHVGLKGWDLPRAKRPRANLTFLIDVSGSMASDDKLPLIRKRPAAARRRPPAGRHRRHRHLCRPVRRRPAADQGPRRQNHHGRRQGPRRRRLDGRRGRHPHRLRPRRADVRPGSGEPRSSSPPTATSTSASIDPRRLEDLIAEKRKTGVYLTILGVGQGNLNDALMQRLAQAGNGQAAYIDSLLEARKVWIEELGSTMFPIADDVKIQVEFNLGPGRRIPSDRLRDAAAGARRLRQRQDVDAGEIGSGHSVTALYEFRPVGAPGILNEPLRYGQATGQANLVPASAKSGELAFLRLRYKQPRGDTSALIERPVTETDGVARIKDAPEDVRFAVAVAGFGQMLRRDESVDSLRIGTKSPAWPKVPAAPTRTAGAPSSSSSSTSRGAW